ncbi:MAG TPA: hypothetical protein VD932_07290 [Aquabacterium sp.]|nr:hypothetical protein [Aquabacterium sp.]
MLAPLTLVLCLLAAGCDQLGIESASAIAARKEADGKAIGGACRHAARAIEDCYVLNRRADRAAIYAGWREMNEYMRENKLEPVLPQIQPETQVAAAKAPESEAADEAAKPGDKAGDKAGEKHGTKANDMAEKPTDAPPRRRRPAP